MFGTNEFKSALTGAKKEACVRGECEVSRSFVSRSRACAYPWLDLSLAGCIFRSL